MASRRDFTGRRRESSKAARLGLDWSNGGRNGRNDPSALSFKHLVDSLPSAESAAAMAASDPYVAVSGVPIALLLGYGVSRAGQQLPVFRSGETHYFYTLPKTPFARSGEPCLITSINWICSFIYRATRDSCREHSTEGNDPSHSFSTQWYFIYFLPCSK